MPKTKRAAHGGPLPKIRRAVTSRLEIQPPHPLRVRRCVDHGRAGCSTQSNAGRDAGRRLDFEMRDLEARQALSHLPAARAVVVAPEDAEVRGDIQLLRRVVADDVVYR